MNYDRTNAAALPGIQDFGSFTAIDASAYLFTINEEGYQLLLTTSVCVYQSTRWPRMSGP